jgi:hypothetical protein
MPDTEEIVQMLEKSVIPGYMKHRLLSYILDGESVGHFLTAVLSNNLKDAVGHADAENLTKLPEYVRYLYNYAPADCWNSPAAVKAWIEQGGLNKTRRKDAGDEEPQAIVQSDAQPHAL